MMATGERARRAVRSELGVETRKEVQVPVDGGRTVLHGDLDIPAGAGGLVVFAHGSGSSRKSPRNRHVAGGLRAWSLGTLLIDLLTEEEEAVDLRTGHLRFDIGLLSDRVVRIVDWLAEDPDAAGLRIGLFGASTGAAGALVAAARRPKEVRAVVSRGGRPDLAELVLRDVRAPTLLVVGGRDTEVIELNRKAVASIAGTKRLVIVAGATHLFEEPGALDEVSRLACEWFVEHLIVRTESAAQVLDT